jgi:flagellar protein FliO/FliZ
MWLPRFKLIACITLCNSMFKKMSLNVKINVNFMLKSLTLCFLLFSNLTLAQTSVDNISAQTPNKIVAIANTEKNDRPLIVEASLNLPVDKTPKTLSIISGAQGSEVPVVGKHVGGNMDAMTMIVSLLLVLALVVAFAFITKRFQPARLNSQGISLVTSMALSAKERIIVIQVGDKQQLLGVTAQQITLLDTLEKPLTVNKPLTAELGQSFIGLLQQQFKKKN